MSIFDSHLEKARRALADSNSACAVAVAALDAHRLKPADPGDALAQKQHLRTDSDLAEDVRIAEGVVAHWQSVVAKLDAEAAEKASIAQHAAMLKRQAASARRVASLPEKARALISELEWLAAEQAAFAAHNASGGKFIAEPEFAARATERRVIPARYETRLAWFDASGERYSSNMTICPRMGHDIVADDRVQREVLDEVESERVIMPTMPASYLELLPELKMVLGL